MKANPLILAIVVLAILGGAVYYTTEHPPADKDAKPKLVDSKDEDVVEVTVRKAGQEPITVTRGDDAKWKFGGSLSAVPADDSAIGLMITNLASMDADRVVEEQVADWTPFGLVGDGELSVDVKFKEGDPKKIIFGRQSPTGSNVFVRIEGDPKLYTAYNYVKSSFDKTVFDWRDKDLLQADEASVSIVRLKIAGREMELGKTGDNWQILKPGPVRGDNFVVGDLARAIQNAQMTSVASDGPDAPGVSFNRPYASAEIVDAKGAHTLTVAESGGRYYAKSSDQPGVYEIAATTAESLNKTVDDLRNKKLFDFGFAAISRLQVRSGDKSAAISKQDDKWLLTSDANRELDGEKVQALIDALRNLSATAFPSSPAGVSSPAIEAEVQESAEGKQPEKVVISNPAQARVYAARVGEPSVYEIEKNSAEEITRALDAVLEPAKTEAQP